MCGAIATDVREKHRVPHTAQLMIRAASLVGSLHHREDLAAMDKHLWHERHVVEPTSVIERTKDFRFATHADKFSRRSTGLGLDIRSINVPWRAALPRVGVALAATPTSYAREFERAPSTLDSF